MLLLLACAGDPKAAPVADDSGSPPAECAPGAAAVPSTPWFRDVTAAAGLDAELTDGFGRVTVVDLDGDHHDDLVGVPAHDGNHAEPPGDFDRLVLRAVGDGTFEDWTDRSGLAELEAGLVVFGDVDNDGDQDLFAGTIQSAGLDDAGVWLNDGAGTFTHAGLSGVEVEQLDCGSYTCTESQITATFADFNQDGALDLYVGGWYWSDGETDLRYSPPPRDKLYQGVGDGTFEDRTRRLGDQTHPEQGASDSFGRAAMGVAPGDYDNDGDLDLFVGNYGAGRPVGPDPDAPICEPPTYEDQDLLWRNDGGMNLVDVAGELGLAATPRGPMDIQEEEPLVMGDECPEEVRGSYPGPIGGNSFTPEWGDFDNDGDLDLVAGSIAHADYVQSDRTLLFVNQGGAEPTFTEESLERGLSWREDEKHPNWVDLDHDGLLDLVITGFRDPANNTLYVYHQQPDHTFRLLSTAETGIGDQHQEGLELLDHDGDGDLDLYLAEDDGSATLWENTAADANHFLVLRLVATAPRDATGARVTLTTSAGTQLRELTGGHGHYNPQHPRAAYFGLGGDTCAGEVTVRWPGGEVEVLGELPADQVLLVEQGVGVTPIDG